MPGKRDATHAGSWYSSNRSQLSSELDQWLDAVPDSVDLDGSRGSVSLPVRGARAIIAPHAGFSFSGPTAAWAYKAWDISQAKRVFLIGPSHHYYLRNCALSMFDHYETPLGDLKIDRATTAELHATGKFSWMSADADEAEHSLEMHLPYILKILSKSFAKAADYPSLVPILVGNTSANVERDFGALLAPYLADPTNSFVVSSDFAHWGLRFQYTHYLPDLQDMSSGIELRSSDRSRLEPKIYESIAQIDQYSMDSIESGKHADFGRVLATTSNTVCGRHPIGIIMASMEVLGGTKQPFRFVRYTRSSDCSTVQDSSVSYASAYAVLDTA